MLALAAAGIVVTFRRRDRGARFVALTALALSTVPIILYGDPRYRVPAEPFFAILAAAGACALVRAYVRRSADRRRDDTAPTARIGPPVPDPA